MRGWRRGLGAVAALLFLLSTAGGGTREVPDGTIVIERQESARSSLGAPVGDLVRIGVPYISQKGLLPSGCEIVSALMVLQHYGYDLSARTFVREYLDSRPLVKKAGRRAGPSPEDAFVGNPYDAGGFGCYPPVIKRALDRILSPRHKAADTSGADLEELVSRYIDRGVPVLVWATINLLPSEKGAQWIDARTGETVTWLTQEHCMVLVGYDDASYYFNDPYNNNGVRAYPKDLVNKRYGEMGRRSLVLRPA